MKNVIRPFVKALIATFFLFSSYTVFSQQNKIDSVKNRFNESINREEMVHIQEGMFAFYVRQGQVEKALAEINELLASQKAKTYNLSSLGYKLKGTCYSVMNKFDTAFIYYRKALRNIKNKDAISLKIAGSTYKNMSSAFQILNQLDSAVFYAKKSEQLFRKANDYSGLCSLALSNVVMYFNYEKYVEAAEWLQKLADYNKVNKSPWYEALYYKSRGILNNNIDNNTAAIKDLKESIKYFKKESDFVNLLDAEFILGYIYYEEGKIKECNKIFDKAIEVTQQKNIPIQETYVIYLGYYVQLLAKQNRIEKAKEILALAKDKMQDFYYEADAVLKVAQAKLLIAEKKYQKALVLLQQIDTTGRTTEVQQRYNKELMHVMKKTGNTPKLVNTLERILYLNGVQNNENLKKQITKNTIKYEAEKKEIENKKLKAEKEYQQLLMVKESRKKWGLVIILTLVITVLTVLFYYNSRNKKQKQLIEQLQRELHHRIKNNLAIIDSLVEDIKLDIEQGNLEQRLTDLQNRIISINEIHAQLYRNRDITNLNLQKYVAVLVNNIENSFANPNIEVQQNISPALQIRTEKLFPLGLIINEFVTNSYKYAFSPNQKGNVKIDISETAESYQLQLSDNGKGLPNNFNIENLTSFGMEVMQLLSKQLQGSFVLNGTNGVTINIDFPK